MKLKELLHGLDVLELHADVDLDITGVQYDSRQVTSGDLFVAISGFQTDGHRYIPKAMENGAVCIDRDKCVGCLTCVLLCPYGAVQPGPDGAAMKCELCLKNSCGAPACVSGCPNGAIVYEERGETA